MSSTINFGDVVLIGVIVGVMASSVVYVKYNQSEHACVRAVTSRFSTDAKVSDAPEWLGKAVDACRLNKSR